MNVYKITVMVVDHDGLGPDGVVSVIENENYANDCIIPSVASVETREVEWHQEHDLNLIDGWKEEFTRLFKDTP